MLLGAARYLKQQSPWRVVVVGTVILLMIAYLDWLTGPDIRLGMLYIAPLAMTAYFAGARAGTAMSMITVGMLLYMNLTGKRPFKYHSEFYTYLDALVRLTLFMMTTFVISQWKQMGQRLEQLVAERTAELSAEVAERKAAEQALHKLALKLSDVEDAERRRLAHDIHDAVGQNLSVMKFRMQAAAAACTNGQAEAFSESLGLIESLIRQTRTLTFDLHPPMLEDLGLTAALRWLAKTFGAQTQVQITVEEYGVPVKLPVSVASHLFRSTKELVNNAKKHGQATEVVISVHWRPTDVRIVVDDNGSGFEPKAAFEHAATGLGLSGIRERTTTLGGALDLESEAGKGSRAILRVPAAL